MEKKVENSDQFNTKIYINKLRDLRMERLILNNQLSELVVEYNNLKMKIKNEN